MNYFDFLADTCRAQAEQYRAEHAAQAQRNMEELAKALAPRRIIGYCQECGQPCEAHVMDFGHGECRYAGAVNKQVVSKCCDGTIFEDADMTLEYEPGELNDY